jgi:hypothetical protein
MRRHPRQVGSAARHRPSTSSPATQTHTPRQSFNRSVQTESRRSTALSADVQDELAPGHGRWLTPIALGQSCPASVCARMHMKALNVVYPSAQLHARATEQAAELMCAACCHTGSHLRCDACVSSFCTLTLCCMLALFANGGSGQTSGIGKRCMHDACGPTAIATLPINSTSTSQNLK